MIFQPDDPFVRSDRELARRIYDEKLALARTLPAPRTVLELGVRAGYSAAVWLTAWPGCQYHGLDNDTCDWQLSLDRARTMLQAHFPGRWRISLHDTQRYDTLPQGPCDLVYVDADHSYEGCLHDLRAAAKVARRIWVDDLKHHAGTVGKAVVEFLKDKRCRSFDFHDTLRGDVVIELDGPLVWSSGGDWGDTLAQLHTVRHFGGGKLALVDRPVRRPYTPELVDKVYRPLLERQPFITEVVTEEQYEAIDLDLWRRLPHPRLSLADAVARVFNAPPCTEPWLVCDEPEPVAEVVINRTCRYRACDHAWPRIMRKYPSKVFVGLEDEWKDFQERFGKIDWHPTEDFWQVARVVKGAKLVCANQSSVYWLASGLGVPTWLEVDHTVNNCRLDRPGATYFNALAGEALVLPDVSP